MSTGNYSHTTRATGTVLTASIYNADHTNHITNQNPQGTGAYSDNVTQMQANTSPGGVGSENLATSMAGELERIRFQLKGIIGGTQWYTAAPTSLTSLVGAGVADDSITNAKLANMAQATIKARNTGIGTGDPQDLTLTQVLDFVGSAANGDMLIRTGGNWARLAIGSSTNVLQVSGGVPVWATVPSTSPATAAEVRSSSATITIPGGATKLLIYLWGGGGGGGGGKFVAGCCGGPGVGGSAGGAGALIKYLSGLTPGNTLSLTIGAAGTGGTNSPTSGTAGGNSTLASGTQVITTLTANGGGLGAGGNGAVGASGVGGTATNGDANVSGQPGVSTTGGDPGIAFGGGGRTVSVTGAAVAGVNGTGFGAGGSGASCSVSSAAGGNGAGGMALFYWFA